MTGCGFTFIVTFALLNCISRRRWAIPSNLIVVGAIVSLPASSAAEPTFTRLTSDGRLKQRPQWSPDGRSLVYTEHVGAKIRLMVLNRKSKQLRRLTTHDNPEFDATWAPDGKQLAFTFDKTSPNQGDLEVHLFRIADEKQTPLAVTEGKLSHEEWPAWSPKGKQVAYTSTCDGNQELYVVGIDGKNRKRLTSHPAIDAHPAWSPDGTHLAFATNRWGDMEIAILELKTGTVNRLTHNRGLDDYPAWSPDGKRIAWTSSRRGNFEIYSMAADGSDEVNLTVSPGIDNFPTWTPRGKLTFVSNVSGAFEIYLMK